MLSLFQTLCLTFRPFSWMRGPLPNNGPSKGINQNLHKPASRPPSAYEKACLELGVDVRASFDMVRQRYLTLVRVYHPDLNRHRRQEAEAKLKRLNLAYKLISDYHTNQRLKRA